jgi:hypothetical protein
MNTSSKSTKYCRIKLIKNPKMIQLKEKKLKDINFLKETIEHCY